MNRTLKNLKRITVRGHFRGRDIEFPAKHSKIFDMDNEEESAKYFYWKETFGFIIDRTEVV